MSPDVGATTVRAAGPGDAGAIADLERSVFGTDEGARRLRRSLAEAGSLEGWVVEGPTGLRAFATACVIADEAEIQDVTVVPDLRRQGVATALLHAVLADLRRRGIGRAVLEVGATNGPALGLYRRLGFVRCGRRPGYYSGGTEDALVLAVSLA